MTVRGDGDLDLSEFETQGRGDGQCSFRQVVSFFDDDQYAKIEAVLPKVKQVRHTKIAEVISRWAKEGDWRDELGKRVAIGNHVVSRHRRSGCQCGVLIDPKWRS